MEKKNENWIICSMTGSGRANVVHEDFSIEVFLKSVNSKTFDCRFKLPPCLLYYETAFQRVLKKVIPRARVECFISLKESLDGQIYFNKSFLNSFIKQHSLLVSAHPNIDNKISLSDLIRAQESFVENNNDSSPNEKLLNPCLLSIEKAGADLKKAQMKEGEILGSYIYEIIKDIKNTVISIEKLAKNNTTKRFEELKIRVNSLFSEYKMNDDRLYQEAALLAERSDFTEEINRLMAHIEHFVSTCAVAESKGRKLDFICQEMLRESNTLLSKSFFSVISKKAVELKSLVEKLREQVQNIE